MENNANQPQSEMDMTIYKNLNANNCVINNDSNDDYSYIQNCDYLQRISIGLKYYDLFCKNKIERDIFIQFCQTIYTNFLDDYCHFISVHNYHLTSIIAELQRNYGLIQCKMESCDIVDRHYRINSGRHQPLISENRKDNFNIDLFDRLHHHIFHITQCGFRENLREEQEEKKREETEMTDIDDTAVFDAEFMKMKERIFTKRDEFLSSRNIGRFGAENNKFNLISKEVMDKNFQSGLLIT